MPDLVEFIRQLDKAVLAADPSCDWAKRDRVKLSFIGHSMGGFVVTNTVRILSDVFDTQSIGSLGVANKAKAPSPNIGNIFSIGRLVLVSPDIPAETIISGRANFLSSSLRRFQETYLFSNEGDMALKLAATAANYASFPSKTREGGHRLGNVVIRMPERSSASSNKGVPYGIVNFNADAADGGQLMDVNIRATGDGVEPELLARKAGREKRKASSFLDYLHILSRTSLTSRQQEIIDPDEKPIAELFTVFDCTDYDEPIPDAPALRSGLLSRSLKKRSLSLWDYVVLTSDMLTGKIDTHGGYFDTGNTTTRPQKPEAKLAKRLIYGLACLGFSPLIASLTSSGATAEDPKLRLKALSLHCADCHILVLLAAERYYRDILGIEDEGDRAGY